VAAGRDGGLVHGELQMTEEEEQQDADPLCA
jgi:hypothetical protein